MRSTSTVTQAQTRRLETPKYTASNLVAYTHYLVMKAQLAGNLVFDGHTPTVEEQDITLKIREISDVIARQLQSCKEEDIFDLLECYDLTYRIGYQRLPDKSKIDGHKRRLVRAWKSNNRRIEDSSVFGMISGDVRYPGGNVDKEFVDIYNSILKKWTTTLLQDSSFSDASSYEKYQRLSMMMRLNLNNILGKDAQKTKQKWYDANKVNNLSTLSSQVLRSYLRFASSLSPEVMSFEATMALKGEVLRELSNRTDLDPHDREAFRMALKFHTELSQS